MAYLEFDFESAYLQGNTQISVILPDKKRSMTPEEFYGSWTCVKFVINGEEYDIDDGWELVLGENTRYYIEDGQITTDDGMPPEIQETKFENGVLKLLVNDLWSVFVLTEDGSLADVGTSLVTYYAPAK